MGFGMQSNKSGVQYFPGQEAALQPVFGIGGLFDQLLAGKPNAGTERAVRNANQELANKQAGAGTYGQPVAARQQADLSATAAQQAGDNFIKTIQEFMTPAGNKSSGSGFNLSMPSGGGGAKK